VFVSSAKFWQLINSVRKVNNDAFVEYNNGGTPEHESHSVIEELSLVKLQELLLFDFKRAAAATDNFHLSNKLGQGGFGPVYKVHEKQVIKFEPILIFLIKHLVFSFFFLRGNWKMDRK